MQSRGPQNSYPFCHLRRFSVNISGVSPQLFQLLLNSLSKHLPHPFQSLFISMDILVDCGYQIDLGVVWCLENSFTLLKFLFSGQIQKNDVCFSLQSYFKTWDGYKISKNLVSKSWAIFWNNSVFARVKCGEIFQEKFQNWLFLSEMLGSWDGQI